MIGLEGPASGATEIHGAHVRGRRPHPPGGRVLLPDGLYLSQVVVVARGRYVYVIPGSYLENDSVIRRDFEPLVGSIRFIGSD
jgi:hypothetical protein